MWHTFTHGLVWMLGALTGLSVFTAGLVAITAVAVWLFGGH